MAEDRIRDRFDAPARYFLSHSVGCLPKATAAALGADYLESWRNGASWSDWMPQLDGFRKGLGRLLGVDAATICPQTNVSSALTKIVHALPFDAARPEIVLSRQDFPTIGFVLKQAERVGYRMRFVEGDPTDPARWQEMIGDKTAIVHVTHALSNTSGLLPVEEICALARQSGATSIVDIAQSLIAVPTAVTDWRADFVIGTGVKFLCAGPGACFLHVRQDRMSDMRPLDVGWFSHENPFEMDIADFRYADDAMRFFGGTPSPAPLICANAAMAEWDTLDLTDLQTGIQDRLDRLSAAVPEEWHVSPTDRDQRGATFVMDPPNRDGLIERLDKAAIRHDVRNEGFRFSLHGYTPAADVEALADTLRDHAG
ncbi:aminotransferase class V-fold PLP-dependent enzyme [uncultured Algimonas sp.]|uniref:aminotransferase class V-fold PLP-dependent enzyme n=1 Tax=uncultured Algimonas sp. TaxID=1547920 RepID=UPI00261C6E51|nr:aminotransferase class V-fold PLP-dependent enzyme [uncultured Algimonas sp.]